MTAISAAPAFLVLPRLSEDENVLLQRLNERLTVLQSRNREAFDRYEGEWVTRDLGISTPPTMRDLEVVAGWAGTTVDVLEERLDWLGWRSSTEDDFGLSEIYRDNQLAVESGSGHLDALVCGVSFVSVGTGSEGEPNPLIQVHSPSNMTALINGRLRRPSAAWSFDGDAGVATLYKLGETIQLESDGEDRWKVVDRDRHNLDRLPIVALSNRRRSSRRIGRSEITKPVRYYSDAAARTLKGLEANREFYTAPKMVGLNMDPEDFTNEQGEKVDQWSAVMGRLWLAPPNDSDEPEPKMTQLSPASPSPYLDQVRSYAQLLAAEAGIPSSYLGFVTDNPASADAIHAGEARLVKRAERRQVGFGADWVEVARLALMIREDGRVPDGFDRSISSAWRDPATPTKAAAADAAAKLVGSGVLPADSKVTYERVGLSPEEQERLGNELRRQRASEALSTMAGAPTPGQLETDQANAIKAKFDALSVAIRAGVTPEDAASALGLDGLDFTGAVPVTLRLPQEEAEDLEDA